MIKKIAICPQCGTKVACEGESGQKIVIECTNCGEKGLVSFAEKAVKKAKDRDTKKAERKKEEEKLKRMETKKKALEVKKRELKPKKIISVKAVFALLFYLVIPAIAIFIILNTYPELSKERFIRMIYWCVPLSIVLVILSQLSIRYKKGDARRFALNISYVMVTMLWLYGFLGGSLVITETWMEYHFSIHLWRYILLIIIVALVNIIYYTLEWRVYAVHQKILLILQRVKQQDINGENDRNKSSGVQEPQISASL